MAVQGFRTRTPSLSLKSFDQFTWKISMEDMELDKSEDFSGLISYSGFRLKYRDLRQQHL